MARFSLGWVVVALLACDRVESGPVPGTKTPTEVAGFAADGTPLPSPPSFASSAGPSSSPTPPDGHAAHLAFAARPFGAPEWRVSDCMTCHSARDLYRLAQDVVLRGATSTSGSTLVKQGENVTCTVACHFPFVATPALRGSVTWSSAPLACTSCHAEVNRPASTAAQGGSAHDPIFADARAAVPEQTTCWSCHDAATQPAAHLGGDPKLVDPAAMSAVCVSCHSGQGQVLHRASPADERTPPMLLGWTDAVRGDFHGARAGTGYGGTLKAPYVRGQPPLPCTACHAGHASRNAFLVAEEVNGRDVPAATVDRHGVGAEALCEACHEGERHAGCLGCHAGDPQPAGTACFTCHGHEGIRYFPSPYVEGPHDEPAGNRDCSHCHGAWLPGPDSTPPRTFSLQVTGIAQSTATISWQTNELATTYVEYGVDHAGIVVGDAAGSMAHSVTLTGLAPGTTYVWRIRSADGLRNVVESPIATFTTTAAGAVPRPDLVAVVAAGGPVGTYTAVANLSWYPVTAPSGNPVQYRVVIATSPDFTGADFVTPSDSGWIDGTPGTLNGKAILTFPVTITNLPQDDCTPTGNARPYYWHVIARDAVTGIESEWSATDVFGAMAGDPLCA